MGRVTKQIFKPEIPQPAAPPPPPTPPAQGQVGSVEQQRTQAQMDNASEAERKAKGRASNILTSSSGDTSQAPTSKRILLGG